MMKPSSLSTSTSSTKTQKPKKKISFLVYDKLVGESDGGRMLDDRSIERLLQLYAQNQADRVYIHWVCRAGGGSGDGHPRPSSSVRECVRVKGSCMCLCGHSVKAHEWWDAEHMHCRCPGCPCGSFDYLPHQGSWTLSCTRCKHTTQQHGGLRDGKCALAGCDCAAFQSSYRCMCGALWTEHATILETASARRAMGKPTDEDVVSRRLQSKQEQQSPSESVVESESATTASTTKKSAQPSQRCNCVGCKCLMPCRKGKAYGRMEPTGDITQSDFASKNVTARKTSVD